MAKLMLIAPWWNLEFYVHINNCTLATVSNGPKLNEQVKPEDGRIPKNRGPKTWKRPSYSFVFWGYPSHGLYPFQGKQHFWSWGVGGGKVFTSVVQVGCFYISLSRGIWFFIYFIYPLGKAILVVQIFHQVSVQIYKN